METKKSEPKVKTKVKKRPRCKVKKKTHYIDNEKFAEEIKRAQQLGEVTDELADMFVKLVDNVSLMFNNLRYYGILEDVKQDCLLLLLQKYTKFDCDIKSSCFAYFTTVVSRQMMYQLGKNKKYRERLSEINRLSKKIIEKKERGY